MIKLVVGDLVKVDGTFFARVTEVRDGWVTVQQRGTRRVDEYQASRVALAR